LLLIFQKKLHMDDATGQQQLNIYLNNDIFDGKLLGAKFDDWQNLLKFSGPSALARGPLQFEWVPK
jgi:hypothetical protein